MRSVVTRHQVESGTSGLGIPERADRLVLEVGRLRGRPHRENKDWFVSEWMR